MCMISNLFANFHICMFFYYLLTYIINVLVVFLSLFVFFLDLCRCLVQRYVSLKQRLFLEKDLFQLYN